MRLSTLTRSRLSFPLHKLDDTNGRPAEGSLGPDSPLHGSNEPPLRSVKNVAPGASSSHSAAATAAILEPNVRHELNVLHDPPHPSLRRENKSHNPTRPSPRSGARRSPSQEKADDSQRCAVPRGSSSSRSPPQRTSSSSSSTRSSRTSAARGSSRLAVVRRTSSGTLAKLHRDASSGPSPTSSTTGSSHRHRRAPPRRTSSGETLGSAASSLGSVPSSDDETRVTCHRRSNEGGRPTHRRPPPRSVSSSSGSHGSSTGHPMKQPTRQQDKKKVPPTAASPGSCTPNAASPAAPTMDPAFPSPDRKGSGDRALGSSVPPTERRPRDSKHSQNSMSSPRSTAFIPLPTPYGGYGHGSAPGADDEDDDEDLHGRSAATFMLTNASFHSHRSVRDILAGLDDLDATLHGDDDEDDDDDDDDDDEV